MISQAELDMIVTGAVHRSALAIEAVHGRKLTQSELVALGNTMATALQLVAAARSAPPATPPPAPARERRPGQFFQPLPTKQIRPVTDEDIAEAKRK